MTKTLEHRIAWLAGLIDGDGCITSYVERSKYVRQFDGEPTSSVRMAVVVYNTNESLLLETMSIADELGVGYLFKQLPRKSAEHKPYFCVSFVGHKRVRQLLAAIQPFLVGKQSQAIVALKVLDHCAALRQSKGQLRVNPKDDAWLTSQLKELNHLNMRGTRG